MLFKECLPAILEPFR